MDKYVKLTSAYGIIWFVAALINAVISSFFILSAWDSGILFVFFLSFGFSIVLSIPILLVAMLVSSFVVSVKVNENIFYIVLLVTFSSASIGAFFYKGFLNDINDNPIPLCISVVVSAVVAVVMIKNKLTAINDAQI